MKADGTMARVPDLASSAVQHGIRMVTVADLIEYRRRTERLIERGAAAQLPTRYGDFTAIGYRSLLDGKHHLALTHGDVAGERDVLVRVHSECVTGDVLRLAPLRLRRAARLRPAADRRGGQGVVLYLAQEGRGIGLLNKLAAYELQEQGRDTVDANLDLGFKPDLREYGIGAQILADLGLTSIRILTNNPRKIVGLEGYGLTVTQQVPIETTPHEHNLAYLRAKREKLGHQLHHQDLRMLDGTIPSDPPPVIDPAAPPRPPPDRPDDRTGRRIARAAGGRGRRPPAAVARRRARGGRGRGLPRVDRQQAARGGGGDDRGRRRPTRPDHGGHGAGRLRAAARGRGARGHRRLRGRRRPRLRDPRRDAALRVRLCRGGAWRRGRRTPDGRAGRLRGPDLRTRWSRPRSGRGVRTATRARRPRRRRCMPPGRWPRSRLRPPAAVPGSRVPEADTGNGRSGTLPSRT
jgi:GTP cyclohydrolase II